MKFGIALCIAFFALSSFANDFKILKNASVSIDKYDEETKNFLVTVTNEPSVGPNYVAPMDLYTAMKPDVAFKDFLKKKNLYIGSVVTLRSDLPLQPVPIASPKKSKKK